MAGIVFNAQRHPQSSPGKPSDGAANPSMQPIVDETPKPSFRDMAIGDKPVPPLPKRDLIAEKLMITSFQDGNRLLPQINLDDNLFEALCAPWRDALVIKLLGKFVATRSCANDFNGYGNQLLVSTFLTLIMAIVWSSLTYMLTKTLLCTGAMDAFQSLPMHLTMVSRIRSPKRKCSESDGLDSLP